MTGLPEAVVFDCDGTLADTESISERAWSDVLATYGYALTREDSLATIGLPYPQVFAYFAARVPLGDPAAFRTAVRARFRSRFATELVLFDDAIGLLRTLVGHGVPVAVASSSSHAHVERVLACAGTDGLVGAIVGSEDVTRHKPHPEPYLAAVAALGAPPGRSAAIEDTAVGVASARSAGLYTVAVVRGHVPAADLEAADRQVATVSLRDLKDGPWTR
ncbi:MAG: HAD family hydrolase [Nitriliruptoraceae bacterium]